MASALYLIGAPRSGKSAVFDALTHTPSGPHFTVKGGHRYGVVKVPDPRLDALSELFRPKRVVPAEVTFVDVAAPGGEAAAFRELFPVLGTADAFVLVVQAFGEYDFEGRPLDPAAQMEAVLLEMALADYEKVDQRLERIRTDQRHGAKVSPAEIKVLEACHAHLAAGRPLRSYPFRDEEQKLLRTYQFLTLKPVVVVANVGEDRVRDSKPDALDEAAARAGLELIRFCAPLEAELALLERADQQALAAEYGIREPARTRLIHAAYRALRWISFFTCGDDEVRAWTIVQGTPAIVAAGKIHTDMERGFIRAEVVPAEVLVQRGSLARCRETGELRIEGKDYVVQDGDVVHIRFNV